MERRRSQRNGFAPSDESRANSVQVVTIRQTGLTVEVAGEMASPSDWERAAELFERAAFESAAVELEVLALRRSIDRVADPHAASYVEQAVALIEFHRGHLAEANASARRALVLAEHVGPGSSFAFQNSLATLVATSMTHVSEVEFRQIVDTALNHTTGSIRGRMLSNLGVGEYMRGRLAEAEQVLVEALALIPSTQNRRRVAALNNFAVVLLLQGRYEEAGTHFSSVIEYAHYEELPMLKVAAEANLALVELGRGNIAEGLDQFERAQTDLRLSGLDPTSAELDRCRIVLDLGLVDEAVALGSSLLRSSSNRLPELAEALLAVVVALVLAGDTVPARELLNTEAAEPLLSVNDRLRHFKGLVDFDPEGTDALPASWALGLPGLPEFALAADLLVAGDRPMAQNLLARTTPTRTSATRFANAIERVVRASSNADVDGVGEAMEACESSMMSAGVQEMALARVWFERVELLAFGTADANHAPDFAVSVVRVGRRMARLLGMLGRTVNREVEPLIRERRILSASSINEMNETARAARIHELESRIATRLAAVVPGQTATDDYRSLSDTKATTVVYRPVGGRLVALVIGDGPNRLVRLSAMPHILGLVAAADRASHALLMHSSRSELLLRAWGVAVARLDEAIVVPLGIGRPNALVILTTAELSTVTWGVLPSLAGVEIRLADDLDLEVAPTFDAETSVLLVGGPALAHITDEIDAASSWWRRIQRLERDRATSAATVSSFSLNDIAHVGAHGRVRGDAPLFSHLALADGPMTLADVQNAARLPRSIVLSACHLGGGGRKQRPTWPTASALAGRECRSLVVSVLPVSDRSTVAFMSHLHSDLAVGLSPPNALARAHSDANQRGDYGCIGFVEIAISGPRG